MQYFFIKYGREYINKNIDIPAYETGIYDVLLRPGLPEVAAEQIKQHVFGVKVFPKTP